MAKRVRESTGAVAVELVLHRPNLFRTRGDGLPYDSWLRAHVRAGGRIVKIAPYSMVIAGTFAEWSDWTGMNFDRTGDIVVPGALSPVHVSCEQDHAVYVEPNLWVHHRV